MGRITIPLAPKKPVEMENKMFDTLFTFLVTYTFFSITVRFT